MRKSFLTIIMTAMLAMLVAACGTSNADTGGDGKQEANEAEKLTFQHDLGETTVSKNPETVVVFNYGVLDSLDRLGVEVAGVAQNSLPPYLEKYEDDGYANIGSLKEPDFEKIYELDPDLIIISDRQSEMYEDLKEIAPTLYMGIDYEHYMDSFQKNMKTLGEIFDKQDEVEQALADIDQSIADLKEQVSEIDKKGLIVLTTGGKMSAYGPGSRFGIIHDVFGVQPVDDTIEVSIHGQRISSEYISKKNPDYLFVIDRDAAIGEGAAAKEVVENSLVKKTDAYQNDNIVYLNPNYWYLSGGGLASMEEMIQEIAEGIQ